MIRPSPERGDVVTYDFRRPSRISADRHRNLAASHEQLAQAIQRWVSSRLRASFEVHLESVQQASYGEFVNTLSDPGATFLYDIKSMPGMSTAVYLDPRVAFLLIERLLGGGTVSAVPDRPLTGLEAVVMRIVTDRVAQEVTNVWRDHMDLDFEFARFEAARELIEMAGRDDDILLTTLQVAIQDVKGVVQFALPFPVLESFFSPAQTTHIQPVSRPPGERVRETQSIESTVRRAHVVISARLPRIRSTLGRLADLEPGDILAADTSSSDPVEVHVADKLRFKARIGKVGSNVGFQITEAVKAD